MKSKLLIALLALCSACTATSSPTASHRPLSPDREAADPLNATLPDSTSTATAE
ncbi:hypothetical protein [Hymenobacter nitidus]|uniref:hypothetical protein n=1 Tax=Hymenobacter nitidus TaxID=2880929 RepID=UPI001CF31F55|nr:hypothetical protein [Hymenobacter nitidus]